MQPDNVSTVRYLFNSIIIALSLVVGFTIARMVTGFIVTQDHPGGKGAFYTVFGFSFYGTSLSVPTAVVFLTWRWFRSVKICLAVAIVLVGLTAFWILAITDQIPNTFKPF